MGEEHKELTKKFELREMQLDRANKQLDELTAKLDLYEPGIEPSGSTATTATTTVAEQPVGDRQVGLEFIPILVKNQYQLSYT